MKWRARRITIGAAVLGAGVAVVFGLVVATVVPSALRQRDAVTRIRALGGVVTYDYELPPECRDARSANELMKMLQGVTDNRELADPDHDGRAWLRGSLGQDLFHNVVSVNLAYSKVGGKFRQQPTPLYDADLALLARFSELRMLLLHGDQTCDLVLEQLHGLERLELLYMWNATVTDLGMENLRFLKRLRYLHMSNAGVSDAGLACLAGLTDLEELSIDGNRSLDAGLVHLRDLIKLRVLCLSVCPTSGPGLQRLRGLTDLEELSLYHTGFTDADVQHLAPFRKLKRLRLGNTHLTTDGERRLREIVPPGCDIASF